MKVLTSASVVLCVLCSDTSRSYRLHDPGKAEKWQLQVIVS